MSKKLLEVKHHLCSGCCMWSGIEDVYVTMTGEQLPEAFFFSMASSGESVYLKANNANQARMFSVADGRTKVTYDRLKDILGLKYQISGGCTYDYALKSIKREIDHGNPVILGPLDMYHLPYLKMYHKVHIPMHYVLMVGYDEEADVVLIYDCDREALQKLPIKELKKAWDIEKNVVGDKNGFIRFSLSEDYKSVYEIVTYAMKRKAEEQLREKPYMTGISAYHKIAREFPNWKKELGEEAFKKILMKLPEFWGTVPKLPNRLLEIDEEDSKVKYHGGCDRFGRALITEGEKYQQEVWIEVGKIFIKCGSFFEEITNRIVRYLCDGEETLEQIPELFLAIGELQKEAYQMIKKSMILK